MGVRVGRQADDDKCEHTEQPNPPAESGTQQLSVVMSGVHQQTPTLISTQQLTHIDNLGLMKKLNAY